MTSPDSLALAVLKEELEAIESQFGGLEQTGDCGDREARASDLIRALDRYIRLEAEVFYPVYARAGGEEDAAKQRHSGIRHAMAAIDDSRPPKALEHLAEAFRAHRAVQIESTFPDARRRLGRELEPLAYELDEVRNRMRGAYGV